MKLFQSPPKLGDLGGFDRSERRQLDLPEGNYTTGTLIFSSHLRGSLARRILRQI